MVMSMQTLLLAQSSRDSTRPRILYINSGSCNGCDIELLAAFIHLQESGIELEVDVEVRQPEYDILIVTGPITAQSFCRLARLIREIGGRLEVEYAVLLGSCACGGGIWYDSYATLGGFDLSLKYLREVEGVDVVVRRGRVYITGCPARPEDIASALRDILNMVR